MILNSGRRETSFLWLLPLSFVIRADNARNDIRAETAWPVKRPLIPALWTGIFTYDSKEVKKCRW